MNNKNIVEFISTESLKFNNEKPYKVISLFSSCGGMDLGFVGGFDIFGKHFDENPFEIVYAGDLTKHSTVTYNANFDHDSHNEDITKLDVNTLPEADIVIGGFPCQAFSLAGKRQGFNDEKGRGLLYLHMKRVIDHVKPKMFIAENVDGLRSAKDDLDAYALNRIVNDFSKSGYNVEYRILKAVEYGVPQTRVRIIIIGKRKDLQGSIYYPYPTHSTKLDSGLLPIRTTGDAIEDLWNKLDSKDAPANHTTADYSKCKFLPGKHTQGNQKERKDKPAHTVRSEAHGNVYGHYYSLGDNPDSEDMLTWRRLSTRECARLQTFPDSFIFPVARSTAEVQIGNAVPPMLAWHVARAVAKSLEQI